MSGAIGRTLDDGSVITDEFCQCGHSVEEHNHLYIGSVKTEGSGDCRKCPCPRFTWARFETQKPDDA